MGKKKGSENKDWYKLIYYRWKALIRSKEYQTFYEKEVKPFLDKKSASLLERERAFKKMRTMESCLSEMVNEPYEQKLYQPFISEPPILEYDGYSLIEEAEKRFGLTVAWVEALTPLDMKEFPGKDQWITFKEYLPLMPEDHQQREQWEQFVVEEIRDEEDLRRLANIVHLRTFPNKRLFLIDGDMPMPLILDILKKKLTTDDKSQRAGRKQYDEWEEAFEVWDRYQYVRNERPVKDFLMETARVMARDFSSSNLKAYWKVEGDVTAQAVKSRVNHKKDTAQKLIDLAGKGRFVTL